MTMEFHAAACTGCCFPLILPFDLFIVVLMIDHPFILLIELRISNEMARLIKQWHNNPHDPLIRRPNNDPYLFIIICTDVYCQTDHLVFGVFSPCSYSNRFRFEFKANSKDD